MLALKAVSGTVKPISSTNIQGTCSKHCLELSAPTALVPQSQT